MKRLGHLLLLLSLLTFNVSGAVMATDSHCDMDMPSMAHAGSHDMADKMDCCDPPAQTANQHCENDCFCDHGCNANQWFVASEEHISPKPLNTLSTASRAQIDSPLLPRMIRPPITRTTYTG